LQQKLGFEFLSAGDDFRQCHTRPDGEAACAMIGRRQMHVDEMCGAAAIFTPCS